MAFRDFLAAFAMLALVVGTSAHKPASAQTTPSAEALAAARELTSIVGVSMTAQLMKNINETLWPAVEAAMRKQHPTIDDASLKELRGEFEKLQVGAAQESMRDAAAIYARHLSVQDMRALTAFYRTPAGAKSLAVMPAVQAEVTRAMLPRMRGLQAKLTLAYLDMLQRKGLTPR